jgi:signal transduction histidine kinase
MAEELRVAEAELIVRRPLGRVLAHGPLLARVLSNLIGNAVKFVAPGTRPRVTVRAEDDGGSVRLWVEDNGIGIPREHQERVFGVFERLHSQELYPGTGLGLAIVRRAIERMGGRSAWSLRSGGQPLLGPASPRAKRSRLPECDCDGS